MPNSFASARTRVWVFTKVCPQSQAGGIPQRQFLARPPTRSRASRTTTDFPAAAILRAATSPATPAPMTATSTRLVLRARGFASLSVEPTPSKSRAPTVPAAPRAAPPMSPRRVSGRPPDDCPPPAPSSFPSLSSTLPPAKAGWWTLTQGSAAGNPQDHPISVPNRRRRTGLRGELRVEVDEREDDVPVDGRTRELEREYRAVVEEILELRGDDGRVAQFVRSISEPGTLADTSGYSPELTFEQKVQLLEAVDVTERLELALRFQRERLSELQVRQRIRDDVQSGAEKQ